MSNYNRSVNEQHDHLVKRGQLEQTSVSVASIQSIRTDLTPVRCVLGAIKVDDDCIASVKFGGSIALNRALSCQQ